MILFHGGFAAVAQPDLAHSRKAVDFGPGFYVTPIYEQAKRWSEKRKRRFGVATVLQVADIRTDARRRIRHALHERRVSCR